MTLLLAGCASTGGGDAPEPDGADVGVTGTDTSTAASDTPDAESDATVQEQGSSADAGAFSAAFEAEGMECAELASEDLRGDVTQQFVCRGDDYLIVTIRDFGTTDARDQQLTVIQDKACEIAETGQEIQRVAVVGTWLLMPGGDREIDFEVFGNATNALGLDATDYTC